MKFHKISFYVNEKQLKQKKILNFFKNLVFEKKKKNWKIQIISSDYLRDLNLLKYFLKIKTKIKVDFLKDKDWVLAVKKKR